MRKFKVRVVLETLVNYDEKNRKIGYIGYPNLESRIRREAYDRFQFNFGPSIKETVVTEIKQIENKNKNRSQQ